MKTIILSVAFLFAGPSFADSIEFKVPAFSGEILIEGNDLEIVDLELDVRTQFCNFWGTTCAGGPSKSMALEPNLEVYEREGNTVIYIENPEPTKLKAFKFANNFSSCNLTLYVYTQKAGETVKESQARLVWANDKDTCESRDAVYNLIDTYFGSQKVHGRF